MKPQSILLTGIGSHFFTYIQTSGGASSDDISLDDYCQAERVYNNFILRPFIVEHEDRVIVPTSCYFGPNEDEKRLVSFGILESRYVVELNYSTDPHRIVDAYEAVSAFVHTYVCRPISHAEIPKDEIPSGRRISYDDFLNIMADQFNVPICDLPYSDLMMQELSDAQLDLMIWQIVDGVITEDQLLYSLLFYREGISACEKVLDLSYFPDADSHQKPLSASDSVKLENSLHNFYKVVEAIYGGTLPAKENKRTKRFSELGVDLTEEIGFTQDWGVREPAIEKLKKLEKARNERAAHGRVHANRRGTYFEIHDSMELAHFVLQQRLKKVFGKNPLEQIIAKASFTNTKYENEQGASHGIAPAAVQKKGRVEH